MQLIKSFTRFNIRLTTLTMAFCLGSTALAADGPIYYRYKDDAGKPVLSNSLPPEAAQKGYQIVDSYGRVKQTVAPALTPDQIAERDKRLAEEARQAELARQQAEADAELLKQFSRTEDAIRARDRRVAELDTLIAYKRSTISRSETKLAEQEGIAATMEKTGRAVPAVLKETVTRERNQIEKLKSEIQEHETDKIKAMEEFNAKIERLTYLIGGPETTRP